MTYNCVFKLLQTIRQLQFQIRQRQIANLIDILVARQRVNVHDVRLALDLFARDHKVGEHGLAQLLVRDGAMHAARNHFIQFEFRISLVTILLIKHVSPLVILQPVVDHAGNPAFFQRGGVFGFVPNVLHKVVK
jgi:hypothetical protein